ncbi:MAG: fructosamine kinase family protein [Gammaproteobacteria bacterium]
MLNENIIVALRKVTSETACISKVNPVTGGSINQAFAVEFDTGKKFFVKVASATNCPGMFQAEADALNKIAATDTVRVPVTHYADDQCLIQTLFEHRAKAPDWHEQLGRKLALLHRATQASSFGYERDNYIGTSSQINAQRDDWEAFWRDNRLAPQIARLSEQLGVNDKLVSSLETLSNRLHLYLGDSNEPAVLIHGDLWPGNASAADAGCPIIFDPASYFASREAEFGMMRLFGGFGARTEAAYHEIWPFEAESDQRIEIYRLYHLLNHLLIFGRSYYADSYACVCNLL